MSGRHDQHLPDLGERLHRQSVDRGVEGRHTEIGAAGAHQIDGAVAVAGHEVQRVAGVFAKAGDGGAQEIEIGALAGTQFDRPAGRAGFHVREEGVGAGLLAAGEDRHLLARPGQHQRAALTAIERFAEAVGQLADLHMQCGLRNVERLRRPGEVHGLGEDEKGVEPV